MIARSTRTLDPPARPCLIERIAPQAVAQRARRDGAQMAFVRLHVARQRGARALHPHQRHFPAQPVGAEREAQRGRGLEDVVGDGHVGQARAPP
jgi:hypothetical protein